MTGANNTLLVWTDFERSEDVLNSFLLFFVYQLIQENAIAFLFRIRIFLPWYMYITYSLNDSILYMIFIYQATEFSS